jgi:hypothetical protein
MGKDVITVTDFSVRVIDYGELAHVEVEQDQTLIRCAAVVEFSAHGGQLSGHVYQTISREKTEYFGMLGGLVMPRVFDADYKNALSALFLMAYAAALDEKYWRTT